MSQNRVLPLPEPPTTRTFLFRAFLGSGGDPFWEKSERLLLTALIAYLHYEAPVEEQNFATLLEMLNTMQVLEDDEEYQNPVDLLFEELAKKKPNSFAGRQYKLYKLAAGVT